MLGNIAQIQEKCVYLQQKIKDYGKDTDYRNEYGYGQAVGE